MNREIGLIDVDGHHFPNLALMRISAYHKAIGDNVEWWWGDLKHYDIVYMSKVFSSIYSADVPEPMNADLVIKGGTGYQIHTEEGKEVYDKATDNKLPDDIERMFPDYSIYPQFDFAVAMTSRGCPRGCSFCHVAAKEGRCAVKVADVSDFWNWQKYQQKEIKVLDPNITACKEKRDLFRQYRELTIPTLTRRIMKPVIDFTQGLDIRLLNDEDIEDINAMRLKNLHFAWDNAEEDLAERFKYYAQRAAHKPHGDYGSVYCLTNYNSTMEQNLYRIYTLRDLGYSPYIMIYNKPSAEPELRKLQRWCNNKIIFKSVKRFEDYNG